VSRRWVSGQALGAALGCALVLGTTAAAADSQQISVDPFVNASGQHQTAVEPDSLSVGRTVVAVFQLGRIFDGGASGIGWATSVDGGATWRNGVLPGLTVHQTPAGPYSAVSDPTIAYDAAHGVWIASVLALRDTARDELSSIVVSRSSDGVSWSGPVVVAAEEDRFNHDKNWNVCDSNAGSPHFGRCYTMWTTQPGNNGVLAVSASTDGGLRWSSPTVVGAVRGSGWQPLVQPNGNLVIPYEGEAEIAATRSTDGGRTFSSPRTVAELRVSRVPGMRTPPLPSAELDGAGHIYVAWHDCRFRPGCPGSAPAPNDIVFASSADGVRWSRVRRVRTRPELDGLTHFVPGLAVDATTRGSSARAAVTFYVLTPRNCDGSACLVVPMVVSSGDAGRTWSAPESLASPQPITAYPVSTSGRFLGDYISTSFADGGAVVPVFAAATAPADGGFHQGVFASRLESLAGRGALLRLGAARVAPKTARSGGRVVVTVGVTGGSAGTTVRCAARGVRVQLRRVAARFSGGRTTCIWLVRTSTGGSVRGTVQVLTPEEEATRPFAFRVRAR
jgi:hypothetical protein